MKKLFILLGICAFLACNFTRAQKIVLKSGDLSFLKDQKELKLQYDYSDLKVGKKAESDYVNEKVESKNKKEPGSGDKFKESWTNDRPTRYEPKFEELFNKYMGEKGITGNKESASAKYIMKLHTTVIEPGYNIGISRQNAFCDYIVTFYDAADPSKEIAVISIDNSPGGTFGGYDFDSGERIGESYAKCGKSLAGFLIKKGGLK
jgi:hypothetical protein